MTRKILTGLFILFAINAKAQSCKDLPGEFKHSSKAIKAIRKAKFSLTDQITEGSNATLITGQYFSCDGKFGYFIFIDDKGKEFVYEKVPGSIWLEFKETDKKNSFYQNSIMRNYYLVPR